MSKIEPEHASPESILIHADPVPSVANIKTKGKSDRGSNLTPKQDYPSFSGEMHHTTWDRKIDQWFDKLNRVKTKASK